MPFRLFGELESPDFVNDRGVKWWTVDALNEYAKKPNKTGNSLKNHNIWYVELLDGKKVFVISHNGNVVKELTSYEAVCCALDMLKLFGE